MPELDASDALTTDGFESLSASAPPRLSPRQVGRLDWNNYVSRLPLDISEALRACPNDKTRNILIRRLQRVLDAQQTGAS